MISIIIPAYNEELYLQQTIQAIKKYLEHSHEVIIVDNASTDSTPEIAKQYADLLVNYPQGTIAGARNLGVNTSKGEILIFIDADVLVSEEWAFALNDTLLSLKKNHLIITGSRCAPIDCKSWLNKYWYCLLANYDNSYINSGHLIITRNLFDKLLGFDESLETSEDYDFSLRGRVKGAKIYNNPALKVKHYGYPETLKGFINRERWHGKEDVQSFYKFSHSKVAVLATFQLIIILVIFINTFFVLNIKVCIFGISILILINLFLSFFKFSIKTPVYLFNTSLLFFFYLLGRGMSLLDRIFKVKEKKDYRK